MKLLALAWSFITGGSRPVKATLSQNTSSSSPKVFDEDYLGHKAELTLQFFSPHSIHGLRFDHVYDGMSFATRNRGTGEESYAVYVHENFTLIKESGRNFLISTIGILNPENEIRDIREITKHPLDKKGINGFLILITEITDIEKLIRTTRGITYSLDKLRSGATDLISAYKLHHEIVGEVISAASLNLEIDEVCEWLENIRLPSKVKKSFDL